MATEAWRRSIRADVRPYENPGDFDALPWPIDPDIPPTIEATLAKGHRVAQSSRRNGILEHARASHSDQHRGYAGSDGTSWSRSPCRPITRVIRSHFASPILRDRRVTSSGSRS